MADLTVHVDDLIFGADWVSENAATRAAVADALPFEGDAARWGEELYASVDVSATPETTRTEVAPGAIAYWPAGPAVCLFWGPTPASAGDEPRAASPVGVVAQVRDAGALGEIPPGGARLGLDATED
ncbi:MAG: cyclophilin-like family protein [Haloferacaceae archaeon]|jgi:hypothetical protein